MTVNSDCTRVLRTRVQGERQLKRVELQQISHVFSGKTHGEMRFPAPEGGARESDSYVDVA